MLPSPYHSGGGKDFRASGGRVEKQINVTRREIAALIDHTLLRPDATMADIRKLCQEARQYGFVTVCVNSHWVPLAAQELKEEAVKVCAVVGFPLGGCATHVKLAETEWAIRAGAREIDMVINIGELRGRNGEAVRSDIAAVAVAAHSHGAIVKVILETALLDSSQKVEACALAKQAGADFVKTSTGFGPGGATAADIALMRQTVGPDIGVKASGGIRTLEDLESMVAAGATRIGTSSGVKIVESVKG
jgi:deoxyribose-phosphate aldolase